MSAPSTSTDARSPSSSSTSSPSRAVYRPSDAPTESDLKGHQQATINGGLKGAALGAVLASGVHLFLRKKPYYVNLSSGPKAFCYVALVTPCISISAEKAGEAFERSRWYGLGKMELDRQAAKREGDWQALSTSEKVAAWSKQNKWSLIAGAWAGSLGIAFALVARTPQTFSQKLVQARMWAQGLTVGTLLTSALLAGATSTGNKVVESRKDHSWADLLEAEGELKEEDLRRIRADQKPRPAPAASA